MTQNYQSLDFYSLRDLYKSRKSNPTEVIKRILERISEVDDSGIWISKVPESDVLHATNCLADQDPDSMALYGLPFAIKDNIDFSGLPTTAGCPDYSFEPSFSSPVVEKLIKAGAILLGKTNMDQFATGLVGTRSPYGICKNAINPKYISGGSSSGSAVAVSKGLVSFSLGTDTAGSGRVPAAFNNIVGLKPTRGMISNRGVVPACRSLDCLSIFALNTSDASEVMEIAKGFDSNDPYSRAQLNLSKKVDIEITNIKLGVPHTDDIDFFGNIETKNLFIQTIEIIKKLNVKIVEIDFEPFLEVAKLLYEGPWVAERYQAIRMFFDNNPESIHPITRAIIEEGKKPIAADAFAAEYRLRELGRKIETVWSQIDMVLSPTAGTIYTIDEVEADPIKLNSNLGTYTNFMNLLDLCGVSVPAGFGSDGMPFGVTLFGPALHDRSLLPLADKIHYYSKAGMGMTRTKLPKRKFITEHVSDDRILIAVCGAHMSGLPLNSELTDRGAEFVRKCRSARQYRFYALENFAPPRPGMVRSVDKHVNNIELEIWALPKTNFGDFISKIPEPLSIGTIELEDGTSVKGFLCESYVTERAKDITELGDWRIYLSDG
ncbi:MAG: allophanate hydrolase [Alphaproteobacteria bacterium]|nr:allophanate hydrolase [Alphaproteobacteria bacterium]PPR13775.1 MAG: Allophanate hydrolase [Alphaproteobacteria bacterium MarineAlpha12_Bin1]